MNSAAMPKPPDLPRGLAILKLLKPNKKEYYPNWYFRIRRRSLPRQLLRNTGTADKVEATKIGKAAYKAAMQGRWDALDETAMRRKIHTVGEVLDLYLNGPRICSAATVRKNANDLMLVLRVVHGLPSNTWQERKAANKKVREFPITEVSRELVWNFMAIRQNLPEPDFNSRTDANRGINSTLNNARSVFSKNARDLIYYDRITLPESVDAFCTLRSLPTPRKEWRPIPEENYQAMQKASVELRKSDPELWLINQMIRRLGLRSKELLHARQSWLEREGDGVVINITDRPDEGFTLKGVRSRRLPLAPDLAALLAGREGFLVCPDMLPTPRENRIRKDHNSWLRKFIPDRAQANHELRKHIGSVIYTLHGADAATDYLGHVNPMTTRNHYQARLDRLPLVTPEDIAVGRLLNRDAPSAPDEQPTPQQDETPPS